MDSLIEKLEEATEGSRELDADIAVALGWQTKVMGGAGWVWYPPDSDLMKAEPPRWTRSVDAAMALVPEGWGWCVGDVHGPLDTTYLNAGQPWAEIWKRGQGFVRLDGAVTDHFARNLFNAATPALALCIASLKALKETGR